jgi:K+-sensing histidine kinase KdpD
MGGAFLIESWMEAYLVGAPVSLFVCATMLSGWFGGFGPGLLAAALAILAFDYGPSTHPWMHLIPKDLPRAVIFAVTVVVVALLSAAQRRETESLRRA